MESALLYAMQILQILPSLLAAGKDVKDLITNGNASLKAMSDENRAPTDAEWDALNSTIEALRAELHKP